MRFGTVLLVVCLTTGLAACGATVAGDGGGRLTIVQDLPVDVRAELDPTWAAFLDRFAGRRRCIADVEVVLVDHVDGGDARYVAHGARIEIEIPTTPARFRESLVHELAHHVERTCDDFAELRTVLHAEFGAERSWAGGEPWVEVPAERWAEAVVQLVNGERILHATEMPIRRSVLATVATWGRGDRAWGDRADPAMMVTTSGVTENG